MSTDRYIEILFTTVIVVGVVILAFYNVPLAIAVTMAAAIRRQP